MSKIAKKPELALVMVMLATLFIYSKGLSGGFVFDDYSNILNNESLKFYSEDSSNTVDFVHAGFSGPLGRPVSMLSFALNIKLTDYDPYYMKLTNLFLHLFNGVLVYILALQILTILSSKSRGVDQDRNKFVSVAIVAAWLLHPVNLTSVLYVVQRMNLLSSFFMLSGMILYFSGRTRSLQEESKSGLVRVLAALIIFGGFAVFSKENGLLLIVYCLVLELVLFKFSAKDRGTAIAIKVIYSISAAVILLLLVYLFVINPSYLNNGFEGRNFSLFERLLTESRVLWFYIYLICLPNIKKMGLYHDQIQISTGLLEPYTTLLAVVGILVLLAISLLTIKRFPALAFSLLFFFAGHSMESTFLPLEIAFEHRNYLPSFGIIFLIFFLLLQKQKMRNISLITTIAVAGLISLFAFGTYVRAQQWGDPVMLRFYELNRNPDSTRNNYEVARFYAIAMESATSVVTLGEMYTEARHYSERTLEIEPSNIEALVLLIIMASSKDREVDDKWISDLVKNLQHTKLNYTAIESINSLLNCFGSGECRLDKSTVSAIISALVRNTYLVGHRGGTVYLYLSRFYLKYTNDIETAIYFAEKTAGFLPEKLNIRIYVASLYINFGQYESARKHLEYVRKQDRFGIYRKDTDDLYARIYNNRL